MPPDSGAEPGVLASRFLDVVEEDILPLSRSGIAAGNKVFGGAILRKSDLSLVVAGTNGETRIAALGASYAALSQAYQAQKGAAGIPLA